MTVLGECGPNCRCARCRRFKLGQDMIQEGEMSEFHRREARKMNEFEGMHLSMFFWHHDRYLEMMSKYHGRAT